MLRHAGLEPPKDPLTDQVKGLLRAKQKIAAIRLVREVTGSGLKEAKDMVEAIAQDL